MKKFLQLILIALIGCFYFLPLSSDATEANYELSNLFWPPPPAEPRVFFVKNISGYEEAKKKKSLFKILGNFLTGKKELFFSRPTALAVGEDGTLYIADPGSKCVHIYQADKNKFKRIDRVDKKISFVSPVGIAVGGDLIYVTDSFLGKLFAIDKKGKSRFILGGKDGILRPTGVFVRDEKLYVTDTENSSVHVFDIEGKPLLRFGKKGKGEGEFNSPTSIYVDTSGDIYVSDTLNFRIQIFDPSGKFLRSVGSVGDSSGYFSRPKGVSCDTFGHTYVVDGMFDNVQIFDPEKNFLLSFGAAGKGDGEFWLPVGITIDKENYIYVADSYNRRISIFRYVGGK